MNSSPVAIYKIHEQLRPKVSNMNIMYVTRESQVKG